MTNTRAHHEHSKLRPQKLYNIGHSTKNILILATHLLDSKGSSMSLTVMFNQTNPSKVVQLSYQVEEEKVKHRWYLSQCQLFGVNRDKSVQIVTEYQRF
jgi:hypothetical protein